MRAQRRHTAVINQPSLFPWVGELRKLQMVDISICLDHVSFQKSGFLARARIASSDGSPRWLTVPSVSTSRRGSISGVQLLPMHGWRMTFLNKLWQAYRVAPYRDNMLRLVELVLAEEHTSAVALAEHSLCEVARYLNIDLPQRVRSSEMESRSAKSQLIADLLGEISATRYVFGPGSGQMKRPHYLDLSVLQERGIEVVQVVYPDVAQGSAGGRPPMRFSVLDTIANIGQDARRLVMGSSR